MKTLRNLLTLGVALGLVAGGASATNCPGPDLFGYECFINPAGAAFIPVTSGNLVVCDDCSTTRNIGFTYKHYGVDSTTIGLASNGFMTVGGVTTDNFAGNCFFPRGGDAGYLGRYRDLDPRRGGSVRDGVSGSAPNRIYAVEFNNIQRFGGGSPTTFQIQLHENGGSGNKSLIIVQALGVNNGDVGTQDSTNSSGLEYNPCNQTGLAMPWTIEFSKAPTGGGSCDLSPIETKLDDETRFTDDDEAAAIQLIVESLGSQASVDALEAKADAMQLSADQLQNTLCDIIRLIHTPNGLRRTTCNGVDYEWNGLQGGGGD